MPHEQALGEFMRQQLRPLARYGLLSWDATTKRYFGWTFGLPPGCREVGSPRLARVRRWRFHSPIKVGRADYPMSLAELFAQRLIAALLLGACF